MRRLCWHLRPMGCLLQCEPLVEEALAGPVGEALGEGSKLVAEPARDGSLQRRRWDGPRGSGPSTNRDVEAHGPAHEVHDPRLAEAQRPKSLVDATLARIPDQ